LCFVQIFEQAIDAKAKANHRQGGTNPGHQGAFLCGPGAFPRQGCPNFGQVVTLLGQIGALNRHSRALFCQLGALFSHAGTLLGHFCALHGQFIIAGHGGWQWVSLWGDCWLVSVIVGVLRVPERVMGNA
jgi:hypothetical protein